MTEPKWTPAPWRECGHARGGCTCGLVWSVVHDFPVAEATIGKWGDPVPVLKRVNRKHEAAIELMEYGEVGEAMGKANARLIAAAPDLYEALQNITGRFEKCCRAMGSDDEFIAEATKSANAALAKARGEKSDD